jgi:glutathione S-transferase
MKLYWHSMSGHAHRAQLFLSLIGVKFDLIEVDLSKGAHKAPGFLKLNSFGQVPVLDDDGVVVNDSNAILIYVAKKFGKTEWLPEDAKGAASILALIEAELAGKDWIAGGAHPTIADVALYSYIARAPEGNVDLSQYPAVLGWLNRVETLPGFTPFKITPAGLQKVA